MSRHDTSDLIFRRVLAVFPISILILVAGIFFQLLFLPCRLYKNSGWVFFYHTTWDPVAENFGALPFIFGTCVTSLVALLLAVPIGVGAAIYLAEYAPPKRVQDHLYSGGSSGRDSQCHLRAVGHFCPGAIYAATMLQPFLGKYLGFLPFFQGPNYGVGFLAASIMLAIIIIPFIISVSREVILAVPSVYKESAYALGATRWEAI